MDARRALGMMIRDPGAFARKLTARASAALAMPRGVQVRRLGGVRFECDLTLDPRVRQMYFGAYEIEEARRVCALVRPGDVCVDVGANVGYFAALMASRAGPTGAVHAFEPVPEYFRHLARVAALNPNHRIVAREEALGEMEGVAEIAVSRPGNLGWNTLVPGFMPESEAGSHRRVRVRRLDDYLAECGIERVALVKVDVEGFELPALRGLEGHLRRGDRPAILCEVAPAAYPLLGARPRDLFEGLAAFGYRAESMTGGPVDPDRLLETTNVLFRATSA